jgi:hypothetical protein
MLARAGRRGNQVAVGIGELPRGSATYNPKRSYEAVQFMRRRLLVWFGTILMACALVGLPLRHAAANSAASTAGGQTQTAAVPISGEHHHHLVLENPFIRAYEVEVPPHESTLLHRHDQDYVYVVFGDADITNAVEGKPEVKAHLADTTVNFAHGPFAHVARNDGDTTFRNITIQLLQPQGELKTFYPSVAAALDAAGKVPNKNTFQRLKGATEAVVLETNAVRALAVSINPGVAWPAPDPHHTYLAVWIDRWREKLHAGSPNAEIFPIQMETWFNPGDQTSIRNSTKDQMTVFVLEFKNGN